jgi:hypothetical protein
MRNLLRVHRRGLGSPLPSGERSICVSKSGEGAPLSRGTVTPHPDRCAIRPLPKGEVDFRCRANSTSTHHALASVTNSFQPRGDPVVFDPEQLRGIDKCPFGLLLWCRPGLPSVALNGGNSPIEAGQALLARFDGAARLARGQRRRDRENDQADRHHAGAAQEASRLCGNIDGSRRQRLPQAGGSGNVHQALSVGRPILHRRRITVRANPGNSHRYFASLAHGPGGGTTGDPASIDNRGVITLAIARARA